MIRNKIRVGNIDTINVTVKDYKKLASIVEKFGEIEEHTNNILSMFKKVIVTIEDSDYDKHNTMLQIMSGGESERKLFKESVILQSVLVGEKFKVEATTGLYYETEKEFKPDEEMNRDLVSAGFTTLCYIYLMSDQTAQNKKISGEAISITETEVKDVSYEKKGKKKQLKRKVKLSKKREITIAFTDDSEKRSYDRIAEAWSVRGHWRVYKSGHKVWIKGYSKGSGENNRKEYGLEGLE